MKRTIELKVNGSSRTLEAEAGESLAVLLRNQGYLGVKIGCGSGECGSCTVLLNGKAVKSCLVWAVQTDGAEIVTVEGLSEGHPLHPVQKAFLDAGAVQCGFCTPGFLMAVYALLLETPRPGKEEIKSALEGNICRCTGYETIIKAVRLAADYMEVAGDV